MSVPRRWPCSRRKRTGGMSCTPAHHSMDCAREQYVAHACVVTIGGPHPTRSAFVWFFLVASPVLVSISTFSVYSLTSSLTP